MAWTCCQPVEAMRLPCRQARAALTPASHILPRPCAYSYRSLSWACRQDPMPCTSHSCLLVQTCSCMRPGAACSEPAPCVAPTRPGSSRQSLALDARKRRTERLLFQGMSYPRQVHQSAHPCCRSGPWRCWGKSMPRSMRTARLRPRRAHPPRIRRSALQGRHSRPDWHRSD